MWALKRTFSVRFSTHPLSSLQRVFFPSPHAPTLSPTLVKHISFSGLPPIVPSVLAPFGDCNIHHEPYSTPHTSRFSSTPGRHREHARDTRAEGSLVSQPQGRDLMSAQHVGEGQELGQEQGWSCAPASTGTGKSARGSWRLVPCARSDCAGFRLPIFHSIESKIAGIGREIIGETAVLSSWHPETPIFFGVSTIEERADVRLLYLVSVNMSPPLFPLVNA